MECVECGQEAILTNKSIVLYDGIRVESVYLRNVTVELCRYCGVEATAMRNIKKAHLMIGLGIALHPGKLSGPEIRFLRKAVRMSAVEWAKRIGIATETFSRWENGRSPAQQVEKLARIDFLISVSKGLSVDFHLEDAIVELLTADLSDKRDFAIVIDAENLERLPSYESLSSPVFATPTRATIPAMTVSFAMPSIARLSGGGRMAAPRPTELTKNGEQRDVRYDIPLAA